MRSMMTPDYMFRTYREVTPEFLQSLGVKAVLSEVDNTIAPYEQAEPDEAIKGWIADLTNAGIQIAFISHNDAARIDLFNATLGVPAYAKSGKPFAKRNIDRALDTLGGKRESAAFVGDQIFTDVLTGKFGKMKSILVPPIKDKRNLLFRFKRALERPILNEYFNKHK